MSRFLLDTHVVLWLAISPDRIPAALRDRLAGAEQLFVSPASAYELAQKARAGRLPQAGAVLARWGELLELMVASELAMTGSEMLLAGTMHWEHRDPFDRLIVAQAQMYGLSLVSKDRAILGFEGVDCAEWR